MPDPLMIPPKIRPLAVVAGASRGIGRHLAVDLAATGYDVCAFARDAARLGQTADAIAGQGCEAWARTVDATDTAALAALSQETRVHWRGCQLLVSCLPGRLGLRGNQSVLDAFAPALVERGGRFIALIPGAVAEGAPSHVRLATSPGVDCIGIGIDIAVSGEVDPDAENGSEPPVGASISLNGQSAGSAESPALVTDAVLYHARVPAAEADRLVSLSDLRTRGIVRPARRTP